MAKIDGDPYKQQFQKCGSKNVAYRAPLYFYQGIFSVHTPGNTVQVSDQPFDFDTTWRINFELSFNGDTASVYESIFRVRNRIYIITTPFDSFL